MHLLRLALARTNAQTVAFAATLFCVWMTAEAALRLPRKTPRLFMALALFALNWAILLLYYLPGPPQDELLSTFSGFLLVYVGVLLLREARAHGRHSPPGRPARATGWIDTLPLILFRITVGGYGVYLIARKLLRLEYGYSTLALAIWGTALTLFGYLAIWLGVTFLYQSSRSREWLAMALGALLLLYSAAEVTYCIWYAREYWPPYHRYQRIESGKNAPDLRRPLPVQPQPDWPDFSRWRALQSRRDWPQVARVIQLKPEPRVPQEWVWLTYAFSALKVVLTITLLALLWRRPHAGPEPGRGVVAWVDQHLKLPAEESSQRDVEGTTPLRT